MSNTSEELPSCGVSDNDINNTVPTSTRKIQIQTSDNTKCVKCLYNITNNIKDKKEKKDKKNKKDKQQQQQQQQEETSITTNNEEISTPTKTIGKPIIYFRSEQLCWECYKDLILKKFKLNIVKVRESKREAEKLLVALSGGTCSAVLLDLLKQCTDGTGKAKMFLDIQCVHIDESSITPYLQHDDTINYIKELCKSYNFPLSIIPLEDILINNGINKSFEERSKELKESFQSLSSETSKEDLLNYYRNQLLIQTAHKLDFKKIILGTSSNRLAVQLVASTSKGRGFSVPNETSVVIEQPSNNIKFYQPMRDFLLKEIFIYYRHSKNPSIPPMFSIKNLKPKHSINTLCEDFLHTLQDVSNQTVHTLLRSVDKLISPSLDSNYNCSICSSPLTKNEIKSLEQSIQSKSSNNNNNNDSGCCNNSNNNSSSCCSTTNTATSSSSCCSSNNNSIDNNLNQETLCYSCKILYRDFKSLDKPNTVAPYIKVNSKQLLSTSQLEDKIKDFLLKDDSDEDEN